MSDLSLTRLVRNRDGAVPGDRCEKCGGRIGVYDTKRKAGWVFRYLWCASCRHKPKNNKMIDAE